jgi:hypothetical protein
VESGSVSVKFGEPELQHLVIGVSKTLSWVARMVGVDFPPATIGEAKEIAEPGARMLVGHSRVARILVRVTDPVLLLGGIVALFAVRRLAQRPTATAPRPQTAPAPAPSAGPVGPSMTIATPPAPAPSGAPSGTAAIPQEAALRASIMDDIHRAGLGAFG